MPEALPLYAPRRCSAMWRGIVQNISTNRRRLFTRILHQNHNVQRAIQQASEFYQ